jgi:hypothetical protein
VHRAPASTPATHALLVVALAAAVAAGACVTTSERPPATASGSAAATTEPPASSSPAPTPSPTPTPTGGSGYRYIWTGTPDRQFTDGEVHALARGDAIVVIAKAHGTGFADADVAARRLVARDPHLPVLVNFLAGALPPVLSERWGAAFRSSWILRDRNGAPIGDCSDGTCEYRVNVADAGYRRFLVGQVRRRLRAAPYTGVMYDNLHYYDRRRYPQLTGAQIRRLNDGFRRLLRETRRAIGPRAMLFYNGLSRNIGHVDVADRGLDLLGEATGAQDETYCYLDNENRFRGGRALAADDRRYHRLATAGSTILESVHLESAAAHADIAHIERYCFANFLMSYVPEHTFVQFKLFSNQRVGPQIARNATPEQDLDLGAPMAPFARRGTILRRRFEHGWVFVNLGSSSATVSVPARVRLSNGGTPGKRFGRGDRYTIPGRDAAFFLTAPG